MASQISDLPSPRWWQVKESGAEIRDFKSWAFYQARTFNLLNLISVLALIIATNNLQVSTTSLAAQLAQVQAEEVKLQSMAAEMKSQAEICSTNSAIVQSMMPALQNSEVALSSARVATVSLMEDLRSINNSVSNLTAHLLLPIGGYLLSDSDPGLASILECQGQLLSRGTYSSLFSKIGIRYGSGDGISTFRIPDMRNLTLRASDGTSRTILDGADTAILTQSNLPSHTHPIIDPGHYHDICSSFSGLGGPPAQCGYGECSPSGVNGIGFPSNQGASCTGKRPTGDIFAVMKTTAISMDPVGLNASFAINPKSAYVRVFMRII